MTEALAPAGVPAQNRLRNGNLERYGDDDDRLIFHLFLAKN